MRAVIAVVVPAVVAAVTVWLLGTYAEGLGAGLKAAVIAAAVVGAAVPMARWHSAQKVRRAPTTPEAQGGDSAAREPAR